jgi:hypothetical protein
MLENQEMKINEYYADLKGISYEEYLQEKEIEKNDTSDYNYDPTYGGRCT